MRIDEYRYRCSQCEEEHVGLPELGFRLPDVCAAVPEEERDERVASGSDFCILDDEHYFVRGVMPVPLVDEHGVKIDDEYCWGVWTSLSEANYERYRELFDVDPPADEGPYFGWLSNRVPGYAFEVDLPINVHLQCDGQRPRLELQPSNHPLAMHQRYGMPMTELLQHLEPYLHQ